MHLRHFSSPLSTEFCKLCVLSEPSLALPHCQNEKMKIFVFHQVYLLKLKKAEKNIILFKLKIKVKDLSLNGIAFFLVPSYYGNYADANGCVDELLCHNYILPSYNAGRIAS